MLRPVEGQPGLFRGDDGRIYDVKNFTKFESSTDFGIMAGRVTFVFRTEYSKYLLQGWRFTCSAWPKARALQQRVTLLDERNNKYIAESVLQSLLTLPGEYNERREDSEKFTQTVCAEPHHTFSAVLEETAEGIVGCNLRLHLYGLKYTIIK